MVENFFYKILETRLINTYVAAAFFATTIFFILNISLYTPSEILLWTMIVTLTFKGLAHLMVAIIIFFFDLSKREESVELRKKLNKLETLVNELSIQQAKIKNGKYETQRKENK